MKTAMIFAAGLGTRLGKITRNKPKALVEVGGKPLLQHAIEKLQQSGFQRIVINVHHFAEQIIRFINDNRQFGLEILISDERNQLLDTGGGLKKASPLLKGDEPILICNADIISNLDYQKLIDYHQKKKYLSTLVVRERQSSRYLLFNENNHLTGWKNVVTGETKQSCLLKGDGHYFAFSGIQVISPMLLDLITEQGKFSIIDLYLRLAKKHPIGAFPDDSSLWMDLGKPEQLKEAEKYFQKQLQKKEDTS